MEEALLPLETFKTMKIGERLGWKDVKATIKDGKYFVTGINPETGRTDLLPTLPNLQEEAVVEFLKRRLAGLQDPDLYEAEDKLAEADDFDGREEVRDLQNQDEQEAEVIQNCLRKLEDGEWTWSEAHQHWFARFQEIHRTVLRAKAVDDEHRHGQSPPDSGGGGGHDGEWPGPGGPEVYPLH